MEWRRRSGESGDSERAERMESAKQVKEAGESGERRRSGENEGPGVRAEFGPEE